MPYADKEKSREYMQQWNRRHYVLNKESEKRRIFARRTMIVQWLKEYKSKLSCACCGESTPVCLDFHHKDQNNKDFVIANIRQHGWGISRIKKEIDKCIVLCANCHRKVHAGHIKI